MTKLRTALVAATLFVTGAGISSASTPVRAHLAGLQSVAVVVSIPATGVANSERVSERAKAEVVKQLQAVGVRTEGSLQAALALSVEVVPTGQQGCGGLVAARVSLHLSEEVTPARAGTPSVPGAQTWTDGQLFVCAQSALEERIGYWAWMLAEHFASDLKLARSDAAEGGSAQDEECLEGPTSGAVHGGRTRTR